MNNSKILHSNATSRKQRYPSNVDIYSGSQNNLAFDENNKNKIHGSISNTRYYKVFFV